MPHWFAIWPLLALVAIGGCSGKEPGSNQPGAPPAVTDDSVTRNKPVTFEEAAAAEQPGPDAIHTTVMKASDLTPAERLYGLAPQHHPSITYREDVVLVEGGANIIRDMSGDGLLWVIDAAAPGAASLAVGKVAFVTGRCVGRVLHLDRKGDSVRLLLGPVSLTDIYRRLEVTFTQDVDLLQSVEIPAPRSDLIAFPFEAEEGDLPAADVDMSRLMGSIMPPSFWRDGGQFMHTQVSPGIPQRLDVGTPEPVPLINGKGFGAEMKHDGSNGTRIVAQAQLQVSLPKLDLYIKVRDSAVYSRLSLKNTAALLLKFDAVAGDDFSRNVNWVMPLGGVAFPLAPPVPFTVDFRHTLGVETVFSGKNAYFGATGEYRLKGNVGVVYYHSAFYPEGPTIQSTTKSLFENMRGASLGPNGILIKHDIQITAGVGAAGFTAGPGARILTSLGAARGSDAGLIRCAGATLAMKVRGSVSWTIPAGLAKVVNLVLSLFRVDPIPDHGEIAPGPWVDAFKPITAGAKAGICGGGGRAS